MESGVLAPSDSASDEEEGANGDGLTLKKLSLRRSMSCNHLPAVQVNKLGFGIKEVFAKARALQRKSVGYSPPIKPRQSRSGSLAVPECRLGDEPAASADSQHIVGEGDVDPAYEKLYFACVLKLMQSLVERKLLARKAGASSTRTNGMSETGGWPIVGAGATAQR